MPAIAGVLPHIFCHVDSRNPEAAEMFVDMVRDIFRKPDSNHRLYAIFAICLRTVLKFNEINPEDFCMINMNIVNKLTFLLVVCLSGYGPAYAQTQADTKMAEILNSGDLFRIREQYPALKDSVSIGMLNLIAEAQLGIGFNQLEEGGAALDSLLRFHQAELDAETSIGMAAMRAMNLLNLGLYSQAGKAGEDLVNALKDAIPFESLYSFVFLEWIWDS